jgi:UDP-N-acetylmuramoyl-tripeptide--D-alanyl-D-alanine ligase
MKSPHLFNLLKKILKLLAVLTLKKYQPGVIGITGSAGKTSTKEAIYAVLKQERSVRRNIGNFNNELGLPLTVLGNYPEVKGIFFWPKIIIKSLGRLIFSDKNYPEVLILEMAADRPGDIRYLTEITKPQIGVITAIGEIPVHVEFYSSPEAVAREKAHLIEVLPTNGFAILNYDDEIVYNLRSRTRAHIITYGFNEGADLGLNNLEYRIEAGRPAGISFKVQYGGSLVPVRLNNVFGKPQAYAAAAAVAVGLAFGINLIKISEALLDYEAPDGRMKLINGVKDTLILDDSYNASPLSMRAALETLRSLPAKRRIVVLGDMLEIGKYSTEAHQAVGELAAKVADYLFCIGPRAKFIAESARQNSFDHKKIQVFGTSEAARKMIEREIKAGDLILVKGSRAIKLEKIIEEIRMR